MINLNDVLKTSEKYRDDMITFMRDMIAIPSESCNEKEVILRIKKEMEKVGFDEVKIDKMGNILGRIGNGKTVIAMDAHIDTVGIGDRKAWKHDPYKGKYEDGIIWGRGASDQEGGMVSLVYAAKIIKEMELTGDYTLWVTGTVQEEDCDGLCWQYILKEKVIDPIPALVVISEPTNLNIYRGHRGRMEIGVTTRGVSCHGSAPERGKNAVYMMAKIIDQIEKLNERIKTDDFLGKGTITVSYIECDTPSLCAVPDRSYIHLDRRLTQGESKESALREIEDAIRRSGQKADVEILKYQTPSYTNFVYQTEKYYPTWVIEEGHKAFQSAIETYKNIFSQVPQTGKWTFSTNGIATMGMMGIPTIGFGPGNEIYAHSVDDQIPVDHLVRAAAFYAAFPKIYSSK